MREEILRHSILRLRAELASMVKQPADIAKPEVLAKSRELDELVVQYTRLVRSQQ